MPTFVTGAYARSQTGVSKLVKNTYTLLSATLFITAGVAWESVGLHLSGGAYLVAMIASFAMIFAVFRTRNSAMGLVSLVGFAGLQGVCLGPLISMYLRTPGGSATVATAAFLTGAVFLALSAYVHVTKKDFSAWSGMLFAGLMVVVVSSLIGLFVSSSAYQLTVAALSAMVFSGYILFDTSRIVLGGETNYILATLQLYLDILNLFLSLLRLLSDRR
ncbi:putative uncharacterized protein [Burkholderiales bacterium GJ-E10]|nr:putative uncharacterized protein [Burkholderiales bacterium GJ-E10]